MLQTLQVNKTRKEPWEAHINKKKEKNLGKIILLTQIELESLRNVEIRNATFVGYLSQSLMPARSNTLWIVKVGSTAKQDMILARKKWNVPTKV